MKLTYNGLTSAQKIKLENMAHFMKHSSRYNYSDFETYVIDYFNRCTFDIIDIADTIFRKVK